MSQDQNATCITCGKEKAETIPSHGEDVIRQECPRCGKYEATRTASASMGSLDDQQRVILSGWIRNQNLVGIMPQIHSANLKAILKMPIPSVWERAMSLLREAEKELVGLGGGFNINDQRFAAVTYSASKRDVVYLMKVLGEQNLLETISIGGHCEILPRGYLKLDELRSKSTPSSIGFVAMWFDSELEEAYSNGFQVAIAEAGFDPVRVDRTEHINKIDDEIIRQINLSRFVVADFTGHRGGVYFEAGYAMGRDLPVFWTCRKNDMENLHFDIRQYNCIDWETPEELARRLQSRIEAVLGKGSKASP